MAKTKIRGENQIINGSIKNAQIASDAAITTNKLADGSNFLQRNGSVALTGNLNANSNRIINLGAPSAANDAVRKTDLESLVSGAALIIREVPSGTKDGVNDEFVLDFSPEPGTEQVYLNGLLQNITTDYTINGTTITFVVPPIATDTILVTYLSGDFLVGVPTTNKTIETYSVQTTNANTTTIFEKEIPEGEMESFSVLVYGKGPSNKHYWNNLQFAARRNTSENAVLVGYVVQTEDSENNPTYSATVNINGGNVRVRVTGAASETVNWKCKVI
jgi:hypothetical protein